MLFTVLPKLARSVSHVRAGHMAIKTIKAGSGSNATLIALVANSSDI